MALSLGTISGQVRLDITKAVAAYAALRAQNARTVYALRGTGDAFVQAGQTMAVAGGAMVYAFGKVVMAAAEYERKMDFFGAVSDTNAKKMDNLSRFTLKLAEDTIYSAGEIADGFIELGKSGISATDIMNGVGEAMANLGAAGDIPLAESGQIITSVISQFRLEAQDAIRVTDLLAGAANASIADITDIGYSLKYVGGIAKTAGLNFEDVATAIAVLANAGIRGSTAGTTLRQMIISLNGNTEEAEKALEKLGIQAADGTSKFYDQTGAMKPLSEVYQILQDSMKGMSDRQKTQTLRTIFQTRALSSASVLMRAGAKGFAEMNKEMQKTTAADVASQRLDNLSGDIEILTGNIETLMIRAGGPFQETFRGWVQAITKLVQAFDDLDPSTQKLIIQTFAITGATLLMMGIFAIIVGTIFRFAAAVLKLWAGLKFLGNILKIVGTNLKWFWVLLGKDIVSKVGAAFLRFGAVLLRLAGPVGLVIGLMALLYQKWQPFRQVVDTVADALVRAGSAVVGFFQNLISNSGSAWSSVQAGFTSFIGWLGRLPGMVGGFLSRVVSSVVSFVGRVVAGFLALPGRVLGAVRGFITRLGQLFTLRNIGYAVGFMVGKVVRLFLGLGIRIGALTARAVARVVGFFMQLPGRVAGFVANMVSRVIKFFVSMAARMTAFTIRAITGVIRFFAQLPGKVASFVSNMVSRGIAGFVNFAQRAPALASDLVSRVVNFFQTLPGRVAGFISSMVSRAIQLFTNLKSTAIDVATSMASGFVSAITGLPGAVAGIIGNIISAFRGAITSAAAAVRDFAAGVWKGFKDGLGISSPSYIEEAMWQIVDVVDKETKRLAKRTMDVQRLSKQMASTKFGVDESSSGRDYMRLASMHSANLGRARTIQDASGSARVRAARGADRKTTARGGERYEFVISNWRTGEGYFRKIAQDTVDDNYDYDNSLDGMG